MAKGNVTFGVDKGWLHLVWSYCGKRYFLTLGLPDTPRNRQLAQSRPTQIHLDIISGNFDPSLTKYKPGYVQKSLKQPPLTQLFEQFIDFKAKLIDPRTLEKYKTLLSQLVAVYGNQTNPNPDYLMEFLEHKDNGRQLIKAKLQMVSACYAWGMERGLAAVAE